MSHPSSDAPARQHATRPEETPRRPTSRESAASRITAFVYGNILVLAALMALHPHELEGLKGVAYVAGTALSTYVAHVIAELVGSTVRPGSHSRRAVITHGLRDAVPILSSASVPVVLMLAVWLGLLSTAGALKLAILAVILRLAALGWVTSRLGGRPASWQTLLSGVVLAVVGTAAAVLKWHLTH